MITIKLTPKSRAFAMNAALKILRVGGVIAFATETVYGIGCDPRKPAAVNRLFVIKGRDEKKPVQLIAGSMAQVLKLANLHAREKAVATKHWPGALTLFVRLKKNARLTPRVSSKRIIGIRVSSDAFLAELIRRFGHPIAATSANRSGEPPASSGRGVRKAFGGSYHVGARQRRARKSNQVAMSTVPRPDLLLDVGAIPRRKPSTVARIFEDGRIEIVRQGGVRVKRVRP